MVALAAPRRSRGLGHGGQQVVEGAVVGQGVVGRHPASVSIDHLSAGTRDRRTRAADGHVAWTHADRHPADDLPPHLQVAGPALVVGRVEHEVDALVAQFVERAEREPREDAPALEVGMGGGVDRPDGGGQAAVAAAEPSSAGTCGSRPGGRRRAPPTSATRRPGSRSASSGRTPRWDRRAATAARPGPAPARRAGRRRRPGGSRRRRSAWCRGPTEGEWTPPRQYVRMARGRPPASVAPVGSDPRRPSRRDPTPSCRPLPPAAGAPDHDRHVAGLAARSPARRLRRAPATR